GGGRRRGPRRPARRGGPGSGSRPVQPVLPGQKRGRQVDFKTMQENHLERFLIITDPELEIEDAV
ncbi:MAG: hypothetical protein ACE5D6_05155, partial [Candidatus Zixiibacteriota bacterium]